MAMYKCSTMLVMVSRTNHNYYPWHTVDSTLTEFQRENVLACRESPLLLAKAGAAEDGVLVCRWNSVENLCHHIKEFWEEESGTVLSTPTRGPAQIDGLIMNKQKLAREVTFSSSLSCSDHKIVKFKILRETRKDGSALHILDFRQADFSLCGKTGSWEAMEAAVKRKEAHKHC